jgi:hypothetical protein
VLTRKAAAESPAMTAEMLPGDVCAATESIPTSVCGGERNRVSGQCAGESRSRSQDDYGFT